MTRSSAPPQAAVDFLLRLDAGHVAHRAERSLLTHLTATYDLLVSWDATEPVALAGLCHSVYGTDGFEHACLAPDQRDPVRVAIGVEAERLAYLFCAMERDAFFGTLGSNRLESRFGDGEITVSDAETRAMCEILLANEIDLAIAKKGAGRPDKIEKKVGPFYALVGDYVSPAARACYLAVTAEKVPS
ncbi:MAG: DUF6817 domain-containing protein [Hyphomicrobiales bacterium]